MDLDLVHDLLARVREDPTDRRRVLELSQETGFRLPHRDLRSLRRAAQAIAGTTREIEEDDDPAALFAVGALTSLAEVVTSFDVEVVRQREGTEVESVAAHAGRREVLLALEGGVTRPSEIAKRTGRTAPQVSRILQDLRNAGLCEIDQRPDGDQRARPHRLTPLGRDIVDELESQAAEERVHAVDWWRFSDERFDVVGPAFVIEVKTVEGKTVEGLELAQMYASQIKRFVRESKGAFKHAHPGRREQATMSAN